MAVITTSTFDPLKSRSNVRLQQGVPIVDADWNEMDDIRKFEMQAFLRWFVGDGVPAGLDSFSIVANGKADDFVIAKGSTTALPAGATNVDVALHQAGRMLVDGLEVLITADTGYQAQPMFGKAGPSGEPPVPPVPGATSVLIYIDVWERLVTAQDDPTLVLAGLGTESCARLQRIWCVRTRSGTALPVQGNADFVAGHRYSALARIDRANPTDVITSATITDLRRGGLVTHPQSDWDQLRLDAFGPSYAPGLDVSLSEIVQGLIRAQGFYVATPPRGLFAIASALITTVTDGQGGLLLLSIGGAAGPPPGWTLAITDARNRPVGPALAFPQTVNAIESLAAVRFPDGSLRVFYTALTTNRQAYSRVLSAGRWGAEESVDGTADCYDITAAIDTAGTVTALWHRVSGTPVQSTLQSRAYTTGGAGNIVQVQPSANDVQPAQKLGSAVTVAPGNVPTLVYFESGGTPDVPSHGSMRQFSNNSWGTGTGATIPSVGYGDYFDLQTFYSTSGDLWAVFAAQSQDMVQGAEQLYFGLWAARLVSRLTGAGSAPRVLITRTASFAAETTAPRQPSVTPTRSGNVLVTFRQNNMLFTSTLVGNF